MHSHTEKEAGFMNNQMEQIAARIKELREILEYTEEEVAQEVGVSLEDYRR